MSRFIRKKSAIGLVLLAIGLLAVAPAAWAAWVSQDIGGPGQAGSMTGMPPGPVTINGGGGDIWGNSDQFHFAYNDVPVGDFSAIGRLVSQGNTDGWAKSGIMARADLTAGSIHVHTSGTISNGITQQWRDTANAGSGWPGTRLPGSPNSSGQPYWMRLDRVGNTFDSYWAPDAGGTPGAWTGVQTHNSPNMPATAYLGLSVTAHNNGLLSQAVFDGLAGFQLFDATRNSNGGFWDVPVTWTPPGTPGANDYLIVDDTDTVTSRLTGDVGGRLDIIDNGSVVVQPGAVLTISSVLNANSGAAVGMTIGGTLIADSVNAAGVVAFGPGGTLEVGSGTIVGVGSSGDSNVTVNTGILGVGAWNDTNTAGTLTKRGPGTLGMDNSLGLSDLGDTTVRVEEGEVYLRGGDPLAGATRVELGGGMLTLEPGVTAGGTANDLRERYYSGDDAAYIDPLGPGQGYLAQTPVYDDLYSVGSARMTAASDHTYLDLDQDPNTSNDWYIRTGGTADPPVRQNDPNNFGAVWSGTLTIAAPGMGVGDQLEAGEITLATASDDGSTWFVDGQLVVNNNYYQGRTERSGTVLLGPGTHEIYIGWYEGGGGANMEAKFGQGAGVPYGSLTFVDPTNGAQAGMWSSEATPDMYDLSAVTVAVDAPGSTLNTIARGSVTLGTLELHDTGVVTIQGAAGGMNITNTNVVTASNATAGINAAVPVTLQTVDMNSGTGSQVAIEIGGPEPVTVTGATLDTSNGRYRVMPGGTLRSNGLSLGGALLELAGGTGSIGDQVTPPATPAGSATAIWTFDSSSGADSSGNNLHGTGGGPVSYSAETAVGTGQSLDLTGGDGYIEIPYNALLGLNTFSVSAWVHLASEPGTYGILGTRFGGDNTFDYKAESAMIHGDIGDGSIWLNTGLDINAGDTGSNGQGGDLPLGQWHLVTYVFDNGPQQVQMYIDDDLKDTISYGGPGLLMKPGQSMRIGHSSGSEYMDGLIDDVRIYPSALTQPQIASLMPTVAPADVSDVDVLVSANSRLHSRSRSSLDFRDLTLNDGVTLTTTGGDMSFQTSGVAGPAGRRGTIAPQEQVTLHGYGDGGTATTLAMNGGGTLRLDNSTGGISAAATTFEVIRGTLAASEPNELGTPGSTQVLLRGGTFQVTGEETPVSGIRGSLFWPVLPRDTGTETVTNLEGAAYQAAASRVFTGDKAGTVLTMTEVPGYNTLVTGSTFCDESNNQDWGPFPSLTYDWDDLVTAFSGTFTPRTTGSHNFHWDNDDRGTMFLDLNRNGTFEAGERVAPWAWNQNGNVTLTAGTEYNAIFMAQEWGGGKDADWRMTEPGGSEAIVNPSDGRGTWETLGAGPIDIQATVTVDNGPGDALMGSLFRNTSPPNDETYMNLDGEAYSHSTSRVVTGTKAGTILIPGREEAGYDIVLTGSTQCDDNNDWGPFPTLDSDWEHFVTAYSGEFTPRLDGSHNFHWNNDDRGLMYLDLNQDNVFDASERVAGYAWENNGNVDLTAGQTYGVIYMAQEFTGGRNVHWYFTEPGGSEQRVNPGDSAQAGLWSTPGVLATSTLQLITDSTANLRELVLVNGNLRIFGAPQLTVEQASVDPATGGQVGLILETDTIFTGATGPAGAAFNGNNATVTIAKLGNATLTVNESGTGLQNANIEVTQGRLYAPVAQPFGANGTLVTVAGGTFELRGAPDPAAGLMLGEISANWSFAPNPENHGFQDRPYHGLVNTKHATDPLQWRDNRTFVYTGQFYDADGVFAFAENIDDNVSLVIDGTEVIRNQQWNVPTTTGRLDIGMGPEADGWHDFEVRFSHGGGGAGPVAGNGWTTTKGFGLNANPPDPFTSTQGTDYNDSVVDVGGTLWRVMRYAAITAPEINIGVDGPGGTLALNTYQGAALGNLNFKSGTLDITGAPDGVTFTGGGVDPGASDFALNNPMDVAVNGPYDGGGATATFNKTGGGNLTLAQGTTNHGGVSVELNAGRLISGGPAQAANLNMHGTANVDTGPNDVTISDGGQMTGGGLTISGSGAPFDVGGDNMVAGPERLGVHGGTVTVNMGGGMPSGLRVWLDASDVDGQGDGATGDPTNGQPVATWADKSGNGNNATQSTTGNQPVMVVSSGLNAKPALRFAQDNDDNGDIMRLGDLSAQFPTGATLFTAITSNEGGNTRYNIFGNRGDNDERWVAENWNESRPGSFRTSRSSDGSWTYSDWLPDVGNKLIALESDSSVYRMLIDGTEIGSDSPAYHSGSGADWAIANRANTGQAFNGDIAEILVFDKVLSTAEMNNIGGYLKTKYGITAPNWTGNLSVPPINLPFTDITVTDDATLFSDTPSNATYGDLAMDDGVTLDLTGAPEWISFAVVSGNATANLVDPAEMRIREGIQPGNSAGTLVINGNLTVENGVVYEWELSPDGPDPDAKADHDLVEVGGTLTFDVGAPPEKWILELVDDGGEAHAWDKLYLFSGSPFEIDPMELSGDYLPYEIRYSDPDSPWWEFTDPADLEILRDATGLYLFGLQTVPEPGTLVLLALGGLGLLLYARRRRSRAA